MELITIRDLLVASGTDTKAHALILGRYSRYIGVPMATQPEGQQIQAVKQASEAELMYKNLMKDRMEKAYVAMVEKEAYGTQNQNNQKDDSKISALETELKSLKDLLVQNRMQAEIDKLKEEKRLELERVREELKSSKENNESALSSIVGMFKEYVSEDRHKWELFQKDQAYNQELSKLREELRANSGNMTLTDRLLEKVDRSINAAGSGFLEMNKHVLKENSNVERADRAAMLLNAGMTPDQVTQILGNSQPRGIIQPGDASKEWEALQRAVQKQPEPQIKITDTLLREPPVTAEPQTESVKFNAGD